MTAPDSHKVVEGDAVPDAVSSAAKSTSHEAFPRFRFIPFRRSDLLKMLRAEASLRPDQSQQFEEGVDKVSGAFASEFHGLRENLKDGYASLDPDADTRSLPVLEASVDAATAQDDAKALALKLATLLERANYDVLSEEGLQRAFRSASLFQIRLRVDMQAYDEVMIYTRGAKQCEESLHFFYGLLKRKLRFVSFERVVLYLRFADRGQGMESLYPPGRVMIKLFQNVPDADLEMLFPNTRVAMRWIDRLLIGVPALGSGIVLATTKLGAPLVLLGAFVGYWLGLYADPVILDKKGLLVLGAGFGALAAYVWKQWSTYKNRKARFRQALTRDLYFKLLDNNAGVLLRVLDDAEDGECKEAYVALYFLLCCPDGVHRDELDQTIETWFGERLSSSIDFEIDDALHKLLRLGLAEQRGERWIAPATSTAEASL